MRRSWFGWWVVVVAAAAALVGCGPEADPDDVGYLLPGDTVNAVSSPPSSADLPVALTPGQTIVQIAKVELNKYASSIGSGVSAYPYDLNRYLYSGEAYCSEFVSWVYKVAGYPLTGGKETGGWMHKSAPALVSWHKQNAQFIARGSAAWSSYTPQPGDYVYFVWSSGSSHSGIVDHIDGVDLKTVEGNVNKKVLALTRKDWRNYGSIKGFGARNLGPAPKPDAGPAPPPDAGPPPPPPPPPKQDSGTPPPPTYDTGTPAPRQDQGSDPTRDAMQILRHDGGAQPPGLSSSSALVGGCSLGAAPAEPGAAPAEPGAALALIWLLLLIARRVAGLARLSPPGR